tara:strand:+ start:1120 stop:1587 length:468 start_codon:yes stop_codon:yes gene_type:complete
MNTYLKIGTNLQEVVLEKIYRERAKITHKVLLEELLCTINCWTETDNKANFDRWFFDDQLDYTEECYNCGKIVNQNYLTSWYITNIRKIYTWGKYEYDESNDDENCDICYICNNCINIWDKAPFFKKDCLYECPFEEFKESPFYVKPDYTPDFLK